MSVASREIKHLELTLHKKANNIEIFSEPHFFSDNSENKMYPKVRVYQILLNHAEIPIIICNIYNSISASH